MFIPTMGAGGAERVFQHLANDLAGRGVAVDLYLAQAIGAFLSDIDPRVRVVDLHARRVSRAFLPLGQRLRERPPDVLLSSLDHANAAAILARLASRRRMRVVLTCHTMLSQALAAAPPRRRLSLRVMVRGTYRFADAIVADSNGVAADVSKVAGVPGSRFTVIRTPIVFPAMYDRAEQPLDTAWGDGSPLLVIVGRLSEVKDHGTLLRAVRLVLDRGTPVRLDVVGDGEMRPQVERLVSELGLTSSVRLSGFDSNPYRHIRAASVVVLSSRWEGLPSVLVEALALGRPVVATACAPGIDELLENGRLGVTVPVGSPPALAEAIIETLARGEQARPVGFDASAYSLDTIVPQYMAVMGLPGPA